MVDRITSERESEPTSGSVFAYYWCFLDALFSQQAACFVKFGSAFNGNSAFGGNAHNVQVKQFGNALA